MRAVIFREVVFEAVSRHVRFAASVNDGGDFGAEAEGLSGGIDGGVAAAEHGDAAADGDLVERSRVDPFDEFEGIDDFGKIFAGDAETVDVAEAEAEKNSVIIALDFPDGEIFADFGFEAKFHAQVFDHSHFFEADFGAHLVIGDAVGVESAAGLPFVEDGDLVAELGEFGGTAESGRARAQNGDAVSIFFTWSRQNLDAVLGDMIGGVALQASDFHGIALEIEHDASAFAKDFGRTNAGATAAENVGGENGAGRADEVAGGDFFDERGNVDAGRAGHDAGSVMAKETAPGFDECLLCSEGRGDFRHVAGGGVRIETGCDAHWWDVGEISVVQ